MCDPTYYPAGVAVCASCGDTFADVEGHMPEHVLDEHPEEDGGWYPVEREAHEPKPDPEFEPLCSYECWTFRELGWEWEW